MTRISFAGVAGLFLGASLGLAGAVSAGDVALIIGNSDYSALRDVRGGANVVQATDELERAGFTVIARADAGSGDILGAVEEFLAASVEADQVLVILTGRFMHSGQDSWLLPVDSEGTPQFARLPGEGLPLSTVMAVLAAHPGHGMLLLGTDEGSVRSSSPYLTRGIGDLSIAQGVTVFSGATRAIAGFAEDVLTLPAMSRTVQAATRQGLVGAGYLPADMVFFERQRVVPGATVFVVPQPEVGNEVLGWETARQIDTVAGYTDYLSRFPDGAHRAAANGMIKEIRSEPNRADRLVEDALTLGRNQRREIQRDLSMLDHNPRGIDGLFGPGSRGAIRNWQNANGFSATGYLTFQQISRLDGQAERRAAELELEAERRRQEQEEQDRDYWLASGSAGDEPGLRAYLKRYPDGIFAEVAQDRLKIFEDQRRAEAAVQDRASWDQALADGSVAAFREYLAAFPKGAFAGEAQARIDRRSRDDANSKELAAAKRGEQRLGMNGQTRALIENRLTSLGLKPGPVDGKFDDRTRRAVRRYQKARNLPVTGYLNQRTVVRLLADSILR